MEARFFYRQFLLALLLVTILSGYQVQAQTSDTSILQVDKRRSMLFAQSGLQIGLPLLNERLPEGKYVPILLQGNLDFQFKKKAAAPDKPHRFYLYLEPTANPVMIPDTTSSIELGANIGLKYGIYFKGRNAIKIHVGAGPQYQHFTSAYQARGIIFSDNFGISYQRDLKNKPLYINLGYRYRHTSNLNINLPNGGIDTHFLLIGIGRLRKASQANTPLRTL